MTSVTAAGRREGEGANAHHNEMGGSERLGPLILNVGTRW
jgi:hypothetical protein